MLNQVQIQQYIGASLVAQLVKNLPAMKETPVRFLGREDPLEKGQTTHSVSMGFPGGSDSKESACTAGDLNLIPGLGRSPGRGHGNPLQDSCLESLTEKRSLAGDSPRGREESEPAERLSAHSTHTAHREATLINQHVQGQNNQGGEGLEKTSYEKPLY